MAPRPPPGTANGGSAEHAATNGGGEAANGRLFSLTSSSAQQCAVALSNVQADDKARHW